eukprot:COSAG04_NODE_535_length_12932_cov_12.604223_9_plen_41_part_00
MADKKMTMSPAFASTATTQSWSAECRAMSSGTKKFLMVRR